MPALASRAPRPTLDEHPEFAVMLAVTLEHFRCTLGEVREDYWLSRVWRALAGDPALVGRVARKGVAQVLLTGPGYGAPPASQQERARARRYVQDRIEADTGRSTQALGVAIQWATGPIAVMPAPVVSLLAQVLVGDPRWDDLGPYAGDLGVIQVPVLYTAEAVVAA